MSPTVRLLLGCVLLGLISHAWSARLSTWKLDDGKVSVVDQIADFSTMGMTHMTLFTSNGAQVTGSYGFNEKNYPLPSSKQEFRKVEGVPAELVEDACSGSHTTLALLKDGSMLSWGLNTYGTVGYGKVSAYEILVARKVSRKGLPDDAKVASIACGAYNSYLLTKDGMIYAWGYGRWGMNGRGSIRDKPFPMAISRAILDPEETFTDITAGFHHVFARTTAGRVLCWGDNTHGACGDISLKNGTRWILHKPLQVKMPEGYSFDDLQQMAAGNGFSLFLMADGTVWGMGKNDKSQLGTTPSTPVKTLTKLNIAGRVRQIHASHSSGFAVLEDNKSVAWGSKHYMLGPQKPGESPYQTAVTSLTEFGVIGFPKHGSKGHHVVFTR